MLKKESIILGIDIGGTKVELCRFNSSFRCLTAAVLPTASINQRGQIAPALLKKAVQPYLGNVRRVGLAIKGVVHEGRLRSSSLFGGVVRESTAQTLGRLFDAPTVLVNDVEAMAVAEQHFGVGRSATSFALVNLGTGIRVVQVSGGVYSLGAQGAAGEISHVCTVTHEGGITAQPFINSLAALLAQVSAFYDPEIIVLNGGIGQATRRILPRVMSKYHRLIPHQVKPSRVTVSRLRYAGCLGAALAASRARHKPLTW